MIAKKTSKRVTPHIDKWSLARTHEILLRDRIRTGAYKRAIESNVRSDDTVADLGCGTGVLSFFAAKKGCRKVYAVEKSGIIDEAVKIARSNGLDKRIIFVKKDIRKFMPKEKVDVLIHEQVGQFLWDEDVVRNIARARRRFLKKGGLIIPFKIELYIAPTGYRSGADESLSFWRTRKYGLDFSAIRQSVIAQNIASLLRPSVIELKDTGSFLSPARSIYTIDLRRDDSIPRKVKASFRFARSGTMTGVCAYFRIHTDGKHAFSSKPKKINTHWKQILIPCPEQTPVRRGSMLEFTLYPGTRPESWRFVFKIAG